MRGSQAQKTVFIAGALMSAMILAEAVRKPGAGRTFRQLWAAGILTLLLAAGADFAPQLIVPFAVAVVVAFTLRNPGVLGDVLGGKVTPKPDDTRAKRLGGPGGPTGAFPQLAHPGR